MADMMDYPPTWEEFIDNFTILDVEEVYTNRDVLVPLFRVKQMIEHYYKPEKTIEDAFKDKKFIGVNDDGRVSFTCIPYREGHMEIAKSGPSYIVYRYTCCGYEHAESKTDTGASEVPPNWCPNCGAKIVD